MLATFFQSFWHLWPWSSWHVQPQPQLACSSRDGRHWHRRSDQHGWSHWHGWRWLLLIYGGCCSKAAQQHAAGWFPTPTGRSSHTNRLHACHQAGVSGEPCLHNIFSTCASFPGYACSSFGHSTSLSWPFIEIFAVMQTTHALVPLLPLSTARLIVSLLTNPHNQGTLMLNFFFPL